MERLTAVSPVLYRNHNYEPGDELPADDKELVKEWVCNRAAIWEEDNGTEKQPVKARMAAAPPGITGYAYPSAGTGQDMSGRLPERKARGIVPEPSRGRRKSSG